MKSFIFSIICVLSMIPAFSQDTPVCCTNKKYISELGLVSPLKTQPIKDYISANNVNVTPLTSGFSSGLQVGKHRIINDQVTLGLVIGANMFVSTVNTTNQVYQLGTYLTGRLYFGESWKNGVFTEISAGPEASAASLTDSDFKFQANFASRFGLGYNYQFNKDVTLGASIVLSPSIMSDNYTDGAKVVINMLW